MVVKALSWALRELIRHDEDAVRKFIKENDQVLASQVKREVRNKLELGLKNQEGKQNRGIYNYPANKRFGTLFILAYFFY